MRGIRGTDFPEVTLPALTRVESRFHPSPPLGSGPFSIKYYLASLVAQTVRRLPAMRETWVRSSRVGKILWRRKWQPTPILLPGKFRGWRSLVGYSPREPKESDMTEQLHFTSLSGPSQLFSVAKGFKYFHNMRAMKALMINDCTYFLNVLFSTINLEEFLKLAIASNWN